MTDQQFQSYVHPTEADISDSELLQELRERLAEIQSPVDGKPLTMERLAGSVVFKDESVKYFV